MTKDCTNGDKITNLVTNLCSRVKLSESSGVDIGGSGGSMNRGPRAPGGPERRATKKFMQENN